MIFELASIGIEYFLKRWSEKKKEIKSMVDDYLKAAAKDRYIQYTDTVMLKGKILDMIKITERLTKSIKKNKSISILSEAAKEYIFYLKAITDKLPYEHLNNILELQGTVNEISFGEIVIKSEFEEISLVCIYIADLLLSWIYQSILSLEELESNYEFCQLGIKYLKTAQIILSRKRGINENLREFINTYLTLYKSTAQYFLCRLNLKRMKGLTNDLDFSANGFNYVIRRIDDLLINAEKHGLNEQYIISAKIILQYSIALLNEITAVKFQIKSLSAFKKLAELVKSKEEGKDWYYGEWEPILEQLKIDWGLEEFEESEINYSIGESLNLFYDSKSSFDNEIENIEALEF